ncbi:Leucine-rich repeat transmembrane protein kinase [Rhynchospora pubera]|uniref:Leucine-rich repeat transmembrane protein kinase n=1 Tax=Rhynchospora pubera TaxID=906938 RepID=A0AAV8EVG6_9POAL|nr:Leucine-rich repeat transmembrane protein kinase [Rhynchospora pubera]
MNWCCFGKFKKKKHGPQQEITGFSQEKNIKLFSYNELRSATDNFHRDNKIGRGGFGIVYKGTLRSGQEVAAKVLSAESKQGIREFLTEIDAITNVKHPNLVELLGCCIQGNSRILVYEYLQNSSLDHALLGPYSEPNKFNWSIRSLICIGIARGLAFLHEELDPHIVHRDIKASNILLDQNYNPKIGDFGLAKLFPDNITHISTRVAGTTGYLAPEYAWHGQLTKKADIYSFGILILEIITGKSSSRSLLSEDGKLLLERAWQFYQEGRLKELVDRTLEDCPEEEVLRYMKVALFCTQSSAMRRPNMFQVIEMLSRPIKLHEKELTPPGFINDYNSIRKDAKMGVGTSSTNSPFKSSLCTEDTVPFTSNSVSFTEVIPR